MFKVGKNTFSTYLAEYLTEYTHTEDISAVTTHGQGGRKMTLPAAVRVAVVVAMGIAASQGEVYSSVADMKAVFRLERNIVMELLNLAEKMKSKLDKIQR